MGSPKLSILLPAFDGAAYLREQVGSILTQSDDDLELLLVDDGSSDDTRAVLDELADGDARARLLPSSGNLGQRRRLVQLLGEARGAYVAVADQDDIWAPDRNALLFAALEGGAGMAMGRSQLVDAGGRDLGLDIFASIGARYDDDVRLRALIRPLFSAHAIIAERRLFSAASLHYPLPFDWLMGLDAVLSGRFRYVAEAVVRHRIHGRNQLNNLPLARARITPSHWRHLFLFRKPERLKLWLVLAALGRSDALDPPVADVFARLAASCHTKWYSEQRAVRSNRELEDLLLTGLKPLAGSAADYRAFEDHVRLLVRPRASAAVAGEVARRVRFLLR